MNHKVFEPKFTITNRITADFQFGLVQGEMGCRIETDHGQERIGFS